MFFSIVIDIVTRIIIIIKNIIARIKTRKTKKEKLRQIREQEEKERLKQIREQEERTEQIKIERIKKEDIKRRANELKNAEMERLGKLMILAKEQALFSLSPRDFEEAIADLYQRLGYSVKLTPYADDHGIDIIAYKNMIHYVIQCKRYKKNNVGRPELQQFYGAMMHEKADHGIFITTSDFTEQAKEFVKGKNIEIIGFDKLTSMMRDSLSSIDHECIKVMCLECGHIVEFGITEKEKYCTLGHTVINNITEEELSSQTISDGHTVINNITEEELSSQTISGKVYCDKCGREMRLVHGRYGKFWGCKGYPECRNRKSYQTIRAESTNTLVSAAPEIKSGVGWIEFLGTIYSNNVSKYALDGVMFKPNEILGLEVNSTPIFQNYNYGKWAVLNDSFFSINYTNKVGEKIDYKIKITHSPIQKGSEGLLWIRYGLVTDDLYVLFYNDGTSRISSVKELSAEQREKLRIYTNIALQSS